LKRKSRGYFCKKEKRKEKENTSI